jgi:hypothetical protein
MSVIAQASAASLTKRTIAFSFQAFWPKTFSNTETAYEDGIFGDLDWDCQSSMEQIGQRPRPPDLYLAQSYTRPGSTVSNLLHRAGGD